MDPEGDPNAGANEPSERPMTMGAAASTMPTMPAEPVERIAVPMTAKTSANRLLIVTLAVIGIVLYRAM